MEISKYNKKLVATGKANECKIIAFDLPAGITCPFKGACYEGCYARAGTYPLHEKKLMKNFEDSKKDSFVEDMINRLSYEILATRPTYVRLHSSGDFYSPEYLAKWVKIAGAYPTVIFYAYTKCVQWIKSATLPENMKICFSYGGVQDHLIQPGDCNARVYEHMADIEPSGYVSGNADDLTMFKADNVGLAYHGRKKYSNTTWRDA